MNGTDRRQFRVLYRMFLLRFVDSELLSAHGEIHKLLSQLAQGCWLPSAS